MKSKKFIPKKFKNEFKQSAFESYTKNKNRVDEEFKIIWKRSMRTARRLYMATGLNPAYKNLSARASVFFHEDLYYSNTGFTINKIMEESSGKSVMELFDETEKIIYNKRTENFINKHGEQEFYYEGYKKTLKEWLKDYNEDKITKEDMNEIIKQYKEQNPDKLLDSDGTETNNSNDLELNGMF